MPDPTTPNLARDRLVYFPASGAPIELFPTDGSTLVADRGILAAKLLRPTGKWADWSVPGATPTPAPVPDPAPAPIPPPVVVVRPPVALPALTVRTPTISVDGRRGDCFRITAAAGGVIENVTIDGFEQNIALDTDGPVTLTNVRSVNAWRARPEDAYVGQGIYIGRSGPVTMRECLFGWNGWQAGRPAPAKNGYRHGIYQNVAGGFVDAENCIFAFNSHAGVQLRNGGRLKRCLFVGNAVNLLAVRGPVELEDCVFYGATRSVGVDGDGNPKSWAGNCGVYAYTDVRLTRCRFVGWPGQAAPNVEIPGSIPSYDSGCVNAAKDHRDNPGGRGRVTAVDCTVAGWPPGSPFGPFPAAVFTGDPGFDGAGFMLRPSPVDARPIVDAILANVMSNKVSVADATEAVRVALAI